MRDAVANNSRSPLPQILHQVTEEFGGFAQEAKQQFFAILDKVPMAFQKTHAIFSTPERKHAGDGGIFSIFVSDFAVHQFREISRREVTDRVAQIPPNYSTGISQSIGKPR